MERNKADQFDRWSRWTITGEALLIAEVGQILDANLPAGWFRLADADRPINLPGARWYSLKPTPSRVGVVLSIDQSQPTSLRGGPVSFPVPGPEPRKLGDPVAWDLVGQFLDDGILRAAGSVAGVTTRIPTREEAYFSDLTFEVRTHLQAFLVSTRKVLPLDPVEADAWRQFVVAAFRTGAIIDERWFVAWLATNGWSLDAARDLNRQFQDHCLLLSTYQDEVSAA